MQKDFARLPSWFKMMFVIVMVTCIGIICICMVDQPRLNTEIAELQTSIETSRQREEKQEAEYAAVASELPGVQAELAAIQPVADAAKAEADALRTERDALRDEETTLTTSLEELNTNIANLQTALTILSEEVE